VNMYGDRTCSLSSRHRKVPCFGIGHCGRYIVAVSERPLHSLPLRVPEKSGTCRARGIR